MLMAKADPAALYMDLDLPEGREDRPYIVMNMVTTIDGKATIGGRTKKIGSSFDRALMRRVRAAADMAMIGSATLRQEQIDFRMPEYLQQVRLNKGLPPQIVAATLSSDCDLSLNRRFFLDREVSPTVFTVENVDPVKLAEMKKHARVFVVGKSRPDLRLLMKTLTDQLGVRRLVLEGGPTLSFHFIEAGLVDEIFWTVAPKIVGGTGLTMVQGAGLPIDRIASLSLISVFEHENELYLRYRLNS